MIPSISDPQLRASAEALAPRYQLSLGEMLSDIAGLESWLNGCRFRVRVSITVPDGIELLWRFSSGNCWQINVKTGGVTQWLYIAPPKVVTAAFPHLVDLVRLIAELAREAGE
jgi:hypothetical protein